MPKTHEQCEQIKKETKDKIIHNSMLYFARNGFDGTKISELSKFIGIAQGTMYQYFTSKEELYQEILKIINNEKDLKQIHFLSNLPIKAYKKIDKLTMTILSHLADDPLYACKITLNTQLLLSSNMDVEKSTYQSTLYQYTAKMISQGQKEGSIVDGNPMKLADYYWSVVYLYALKKQFTTNFEGITRVDLNRVLIKDGIFNE